MNISELIQELTKIQAKHGDIPCDVSAEGGNEELCWSLFTEDDGTPDGKVTMLCFMSQQELNEMGHDDPSRDHEDSFEDEDEGYIVAEDQDAPVKAIEHE